MNILTISLLSLIGVCVLIGIIKGATRGIARQTVRTITVIAAAVLALVITKMAEGSIYSAFSSITSEDLIVTIENTGYTVTGTAIETVIINLDPSTINYIIAVPLSLVILPLTFVIIFCILKLLMLILHVILSGLCGFTKKRNTAITRFLGSLLGAISGFAIAVVISTPVIGVLSSASYAVDTIREEAKSDTGAEIIVNVYDEQVAPYASEPVSAALSKLGASVLYSQFTTAEIGEEEYNVPEKALHPMMDIASAMMSDLQGFAWKTPQGDNKEGLMTVISAVDESVYIRELFLQLRNTVVDIYNDGSLIIEADELLVEAIDATFLVLENITSESFTADTTTLIDAYYILGREGALSAFEAGELEGVRDVLIRPYTYDPLDPEYDGTPTTIIDRVVSILNTNEHTRPIINALTKISLTALANNFGTDLSAEAIYEGVKTGISDTLRIDKSSMSEDEYKSAVKESIDSALRSSDITLRENEEYILDGMADYVYENYDELVKVDEDGNQEITDAEINNVILSYYEAYLAGGE